jgi:hypothetical protein
MSGYIVYSPTITHESVVDRATSTLQYNHDSSIVQFRGEWVTVWNGNANSSEGAAGQRNYMATSSDRVSWSTPVQAFSSSAAATNPVPCDGTCMQWQPNLVLLDGGARLGCAWSQNYGSGAWGDAFAYWSTLDASPAAGGRWQSRALAFKGGDAPNHVSFGGRQWSAFPTQNPAILPSGRLLVPVTLISNLQHKRASVLVSEDEGATFAVSAGTFIPGDEIDQWETTVWSPTGSNGSRVLMFDRMNDSRNVSAGGPVPDDRLQSAESLDGGFTWSPLAPVRVQTVVSRSLVTPLAPPLFLMVQNDWANGTLWCVQRDPNSQSPAPARPAAQSDQEITSSHLAAGTLSSARTWLYGSTAAVAPTLYRDQASRSARSMQCTLRRLWTCRGTKRRFATRSRAGRPRGSAWRACIRCPTLRAGTSSRAATRRRSSARRASRRCSLRAGY